MAACVVTLADGARLNILVDGEGPDLLLVSGLGGTAAFWEPAVNALAKRFRVIRFDQRGIGASTRGAAPVTIDQLADDCFALLRDVGRGKALFVGHSTGGVILQTMALRDESKVAGLVLSGTWLKPNRYMTELFRSRLAVLRVAPREYSAMFAFLAYPAEWLEANWPSFEAIIAGAPMTEAQQDVVADRIAALVSFDRSSEVARISVPQLIQGAEDDQIVPAFLQRELAGVLTRAEVYFFKTGGHSFPVTRTEEFVTTLIAWAEKNVRP
jgi:aminoacrylate hydrolase